MSIGAIIAYGGLALACAGGVWAATRAFSTGQTAGGVIALVVVAAMIGVTARHLYLRSRGR